MRSATNLDRAPALRAGPGDRAQCARRRGAARRGLDARSVRRGRSSMAGCMVAAWRSRSPISPPTPLRCARCEAAGAPLRGTVELHFTYDEEAGGEIGPKWLLDAGIERPDLAICAGFSYAVVTAHNGCLHLEVEVRGRSAHAAMPSTGVDALRGGERDPDRALCTAESSSRARLRRAGHRLAAAHRRTDRGRHQHERRARPRVVPAGPADHPRGERGRGRGRTARADRRRGCA